eukprot:c10095_g1_i3.p1 GENE.c10095_g1_i3~~c10095_g1_i3.p1  ORF type:complete len:280 (-),score=40.03 c10095_g1_i3:560-1375(-)
MANPPTTTNEATIHFCAEFTHFIDEMRCSFSLAITTSDQNPDIRGAVLTVVEEHAKTLPARLPVVLHEQTSCHTITVTRLADKSFLDCNRFFANLLREEQALVKTLCFTFPPNLFLRNVLDIVKDWPYGEIRLALFGPAGSGKSSYVNAILTYLSQSRLVVKQAVTLDNEEHVTLKPTEYRIQLTETVELVLLDLPGIRECETEHTLESEPNNPFTCPICLEEMLNDGIPLDLDITVEHSFDHLHTANRQPSHPRPPPRVKNRSEFVFLFY